MTAAALGRLLIVDDEPELLKALCDVATAQGYEAIGRPSGPEALTVLQETDVDVLLSDLMMPAMDGLALLRAARQVDPNLMVILMTGQGTVPTAVEAMKVGAFDYLLKPFKMTALLPTLERALALRRLRRENLQLQETLAIYELCQAVTLTLDPATVLNKVADAAVQQTQADELSILLPPSDGQQLYVAVLRGERAELHAGDRVPLDRGIVGWVAQHKVALFLEGPVHDERFAPYQPRSDIGAAISQPMLAGNRLVGVLNVNVLRRSRHCTLGQLKALAILASLGAAALEAARLHERARDEALLLNLAADAIVACDPQNRIAYWNRGAEQMYGWTSPEALGQDLAKLLFPASLPLLAELERLLPERGEWHGELKHVTKTGKPIMVASRWTLVRDASGRVKSKLIIGTDVTEQKRLEAQLFHAQKLESIGTLTGGVAHDFNNLLTVINGYSDILLNTAHPAERVQEFLRGIRRAGDRAAALTHQLLAFSRKQVLEPKVLDLNAIVLEMDKMLRRLIGEDIDLTTSLAPALGPVKVDPVQIEQVVVNLIVNGRDAMPQGGKLTIETQNVVLESACVQANVDVPPGSYVMVSVTDTGCGMDEATQLRIFEPFFTTKALGKGTGLGLATVYGVVKQSGGHIQVYSELNHGTTFRIYLPRLAETTGRARKVDAAAIAIPTGTETVLLAEDEADVRQLMARGLTGLGYTVLEAGNGVDALAVGRQHAAPIHLLITDVIMPKLSGRQLADRVTALRSGIKVLYISGYADDAIIRHGTLEAGMAFLNKPFSMGLLARKIREVLDGSAVPMPSA